MRLIVLPFVLILAACSSTPPTPTADQSRLCDAFSDIAMAQGETTGFFIGLSLGMNALLSITEIMADRDIEADVRLEARNFMRDWGAIPNSESINNARGLCNNWGYSIPLPPTPVPTPTSTPTPTPTSDERRACDVLKNATSLDNLAALLESIASDDTMAMYVRKEIGEFLDWVDYYRAGIVPHSMYEFAVDDFVFSCASWGYTP